MDSGKLLPIITVQPSFRTVISEVDTGIIPSDDFWVSCYKETSPSVHSKIHVKVNEVHRDVVDLEPADSRVQIQAQISEDSYRISCPPLDIPYTRVLVPDQEYADAERANAERPQRITAFDVAPDGTRFASGFHDGSVDIYPVSGSEEENSIRVKRTGKVHLSTVTALRFFPSSRVLLTAGADFGLSVLPAEVCDGDDDVGGTVSAARTLRGHVRSVSGMGIVARGRNVVSCAKDGSVRLWDVGGGRELHVLVAGKGKYTPVMGMSVGERVGGGVNGVVESGRMEGVSSGSVQDGEVETSDKVVFCALGDGTFEVFDLGAKVSVFQSEVETNSGGALKSIVYSDSKRLLATGSVQGLVRVFDVRSLGRPLASFYRNGPSIEDLVFCKDSDVGVPRLVIGTEDGLAYVADVEAGGARVRAELVGGDCDAVRAVKVDGNGCLWTASDDGIVRKYHCE